MAGFRRRLALLIDGSLKEPEPPRLDLFGFGKYGFHGVERQLELIAKSLASLDHKTKRRRMRVIDCQHPELHPELRDTA